MVCVQLTLVCRWVSCLSRLSSLSLSLGLLCFSSFVPCQSPSVRLWVRLPLREMYRLVGPGLRLARRVVFCSLLSSPSASRLPLTFVFRLAPAFSSSSRLLSPWLGRSSLSLSLSLSSVCVCACVFGAPCKSPCCDSNLF